MTPEQFDDLKFTSNMYVLHSGERKFVVTVGFLERLFGLLPKKPAEDEEIDAWDVEWVRCENVSEIVIPTVFRFE